MHKFNGRAAEIGCRQAGMIAEPGVRPMKSGTTGRPVVPPRQAG
jgi:hypothetical protein